MAGGAAGVALTRRLRRHAATAYLRATSTLVARRLGERVAERRFERIVIVAPLGKVNGIAAGARLQAEWLRHAGHDVQLLDATACLRRPWRTVEHRPGCVYIFHCGGPQTASLVGGVLPAAASAWRIGYWAWELPDPDPSWLGHDRHLHEVWTPSAYAAASLAGVTTRPIAAVPHRVRPHAMHVRDPSAPFTVLTMADSRSSFARKNPQGAVAAFRRAFGDRADRRLLLKLSGRPEEVAALEEALAPTLGGNVVLVKGHLDAQEIERLYAQADLLLSLHRAEGFGLPMLEAMARGVPVVGTGWSGNLEFMTDENAVPIRYRLVSVDDPAGIYGGSVWADPDLDEAAAQLRMLADEPLRYQRLALRAHRSAIEHWQAAGLPPLPVTGERERVAS